MASTVHENSPAYFHTDANTSCGFIETDVKGLGVDMLSAAPHRFYGPKGTGLFYLKKGTRVMPLIDGGIQEFGRRAGTGGSSGVDYLQRRLEVCYFPELWQLRTEL